MVSLLHNDAHNVTNARACLLIDNTMYGDPWELRFVGDGAVWDTIRAAFVSRGGRQPLPLRARGQVVASLSTSNSGSQASSGSSGQPVGENNRGCFGPIAVFIDTHALTTPHPTTPVIGRRGGRRPPRLPGQPRRGAAAQRLAHPRERAADAEGTYTHPYSHAFFTSMSYLFRVGG